jgi:hypothetical protein
MSNCSLISESATTDTSAQATGVQLRDLPCQPPSSLGIGISLCRHCSPLLYHFRICNMALCSVKNKSSCSLLTLSAGAGMVDLHEVWKRRVKLVCSAGLLSSAPTTIFMGLGSLCRKLGLKQPPLCPISISSNSMPTGPPLASPGLWDLASGQTCRYSLSLIIWCLH